MSNVSSSESNGGAERQARGAVNKVTVSIEKNEQNANCARKQLKLPALLTAGWLCPQPDSNTNHLIFKALPASAASATRREMFVT